MNHDKQKPKNRRSVIAGMGAAALGIAAATAGQAQQRRSSSNAFEPARHDLDSWLSELPGRHRIFVDTATPNGGAEGLLYANNLFNAHREAYSGEDSDLALVICFRHFSTPFGYVDAVWDKYGEIFHSLIQFPDPATGQAPRINLLSSAAHTTLPNFGTTIDSLIAKGAQFAICNNATNFIADQVATQTGTAVESVYRELVAGAIPNSRFVPAGVMAVTRAQEYGYSLLYGG